MACAFFTLLVVIAGFGALVWLALRRLSAHMKDNPAAARGLAEVIAAILTEQKAKEGDDDLPEVPQKASG